MQFAPLRAWLLAHAVAAALWLRQRLTGWLRALGPAALPLYELTTGVAQTQVVAAFVALGLPEALTGGHDTLSALSDQAGATPDLLSRLLRAGAALGLVKRRRDGRYRPTAMTRALVHSAPGNMAAFATYMASASNVAAWQQLTTTIRSGRPGFDLAHGTDVWSYFVRHPAEEATFAQAMTSLLELEGPAVADAYPFHRHATLCDVGGGRGGLLAAIVAKHPTCRGLVYDQASVVAAGQGDCSGPTDQRLAFAAGNFFVSVPAGYDAYLLRQILHDWDNESCRTILRHCRDAMSPASRLLIVESKVEPAHRPYLGAIKDLTMGVLCGGRERSRADMAALLASAGLRLRRIWPVAAPVVVWEAERLTM